MAVMNGDISKPDDAVPHPHRLRTGRVGRGTRPVTAVLALAFVAVGCGPPGTGGGQTADPDQVTVFAASSLTEAMTELGNAFEASRPGARLAVTFGGSQILRLQISQGAAADAFASANESHLAALVSDGSAQRSQVLA